MFKYSKSAALNTLDFILKVISVADIFIQLSYITYIAYKIYNKIGLQFINIALFVLAIVYFIIHLFTIREFYTKKQREQKNTIRNIFKAIKYILVLYVIISGVLQLYNGINVDNMAILMVVLMIVGYIFSIMFDIIRVIIKNQVTVIKASFYYDAQLHKEEIIEFLNSLGKLSAVVTPPLLTLAKKLKLDRIPVVNNPKLKKKILCINYKQENKQRRKSHFNIFSS